MKADLTRLTFKQHKHYSSVRMQQGRVQMDADWNEQVDIDAHRVETEATDTIGHCGAPIGDAGFLLQPNGADPATLEITSGRYYVDGILCENDESVLVTGQPDLPAREIFSSWNGSQLVPLDPLTAGVYLGYVDVWQRHITTIEDDEIREVALGGPDTATRTKTVWQVKLVRLEDPGTEVACDSHLEVWDYLTSTPAGRLAARSEESEEDEPCVLGATGGYRSLENQLYRVEVHRGGPLGTASFKWAANNGSIVASWKSQDTDMLTVSSSGRDSVLNFAAGQWVELTDDTHELTGRPGTLVQLKEVNGNDLTIDTGTIIDPDDPGATSVDIADFPLHPKVRRWDCENLLQPTDSSWVDLENGIQVRFTAGADETYRNGDYWLITARSATRDVEWPLDPTTGDPLDQTPEGIFHHYCKLGLVELGDDGTWANLEDCRSLFPPLTGICAEHVCFESTHCMETNPVAGWDEVDTVQEALEKICDYLGTSGKCHDFLDELRADGIVKGENGELGLAVSYPSAGILELSYTGGIAFVGGCRHEVPEGKVIVETSTTHQTLLVNESGIVELVTKGPFPPKYAPIAVISTYQGDVRRIFDVRFNLTHLDEKVEVNFQKTSEGRTDRRAFVPILSYSIKGLEFKDGKNRTLNLGSRFTGAGLCSDGENIWIANNHNTGKTVARLARSAIAESEVEIISIKDSSEDVAYDGRCVWFTSTTETGLIRLDPANGNALTRVKVGDSPTRIVFDGDSMWVCNTGDNSLSVVDVETCNVVRTESLGSMVPSDILFDGTHIWLTTTNGDLYKIEKPWGERVKIGEGLPDQQNVLAFDGTHIWILSPNQKTLRKLDATTDSLITIPEVSFDHLAQGMVFDGTYLWVVAGSRKTFLLHKLDIHTDQVLGSIPSGETTPMGMAFDGSHLWFSIVAGRKSSVIKKLV